MVSRREFLFYVLPSLHPEVGSLCNQLSNLQSIEDTYDRENKIKTPEVFKFERNLSFELGLQEALVLNPNNL